jgi:nucleoside-diphosphate-sugar epimerase
MSRSNARVHILVVGGTAWLGREVAAAAVAAGHDVVCLARGQSGPPAVGARLIQGDRDSAGAYDVLVEHRWDAVIDVARQPGQVRKAAQALAPVTAFAVFVSTGSVYAEHERKGMDESEPLLMPLTDDVMPNMEAYGAAKVACEQHVLAAFGAGRTAIARAGLIGGPGDVSDRSGYWPWCFANPAVTDGRVLVPDAPGAAAQLIDVRDLAAWLATVAVERIGGVFNATGETLPLADRLRAARTVAGHHDTVVAAASEWLLAQGVGPWMGERSLPLWLPDPEWAGFTARDSSRARAAGLVCRPRQSTLADTLAWERSRPAGQTRRAGLSDADESALLAELLAVTP